MSPLDFIPLAEETGQIAALGRWTLEEACAQVRRWQHVDPSLSSLYASVNVSPRQLRDSRFVQDVARSLERSGLAARNLTLEITEGAVMVDVETRHPAPARAARPRGVHRHRRLRHRALVAGAAAPPPRRHHQGRQDVRGHDRVGLHGVRVPREHRADGARSCRCRSSWRASRPPSSRRSSPRSATCAPRGTCSAVRWASPPPTGCSPTVAGRPLGVDRRRPGTAAPAAGGQGHRLDGVVDATRQLIRRAVAGARRGRGRSALRRGRWRSSRSPAAAAWHRRRRGDPGTRASRARAARMLATITDGGRRLHLAASVMASRSRAGGAAVPARRGSGAGCACACHQVFDGCWTKAAAPLPASSLTQRDVPRRRGRRHRRAPRARAAAR